MLYIIGVTITFFLVLLLAGKQHKTEADKILAIWLSITGIHLLLFYVNVTQQYVQFPYLLGFELPLPLVHVPFLYLYTASLTDQSSPNKFKILHFLPFFAIYVLFFNFLTSPLTYKIQVYQLKGQGYEWQRNLMNVAIIISGVIYIALSLWLLRKHRKNIVGQFSNIEKINLNWLRYLIYGTAGIWIFVIFGIDELIYGSVVVYMLFLGYFGIRQVGIFTHFHPVVIHQANIPNEVKYQKSGLSEEAARSIHKELTQLMQEKKMYQNPEITLSELSQKLNVHPNILSQVINSLEQKNFFDYINSQRVEMFKKIVTLPENQKFTLLSLAYECGFNSKTTFNRNFKKATGLSPSEYLQHENIVIDNS
jgi:AraC-like DNA-binding protein